MAVLEGLEGIEVTVCVDNQALREYDDDEVEKQSGAIGEYQASKTVSKYIEAVTGKEFTISLAVRAPYKMDCPTLVFQINLDGSKVARPMLRKSQYQYRLGWERVTSGVKHQLDGASKRCSIRHFRFAEIQTTEDQAKLHSVKADAERISAVGGISVSVFRKSESVKSQAVVNHCLKSNPDAAVHEKALKGQSTSHGTSLGAAQPSKADTIYLSDFLDGGDYPIGIFQFKYRSREALKSLLIIERSPEPDQSQETTNHPPSTAAVNDDNLTPEMKRKVEEFKKSLLEASNDSNLKSENIKQDSAPRVKRENPDQGQGRKINKNPKYKTTIDLTEDVEGDN
ncbi:hypothetical protein N431DRAFT_494139 [Stipitochalara longipes BDJ]|nr:hypothetical protein N431DRAFT_494139 [Stipitochalara longipes BDJ]